MSDADMNTKYPDNMQRYAVCQNLWHEEKMNKSKENENRNSKNI
jgi:hypothetical protein